MGDLFRTVAALKTEDSETREAIAALLGYAPKLEDPVPPRPPSIEPVTSPTDNPTTPIQPINNHPGNGGEPLDLPSRPLPFSLESLTSAPTLPSWYEDAPTFSIEEPQTAAPLPFEPLFPPNRTRALLQKAVSTTAFDGPVDLTRLLADVLYGHPVERLPRQARATFRRGVQLLIDHNPTMAPFARDQQDLRVRLERLVGPGVSTLQFSGSPLRGVGKGERAKWYPYQPPEAGVPVLMLTDLGLGTVFPDEGEEASACEWRWFTAIVRNAGCPLIALVPYAESRWPSLLKEEMHILLWDRTTSTRSAGSRRHL